MMGREGGFLVFLCRPAHPAARSLQDGPSANYSTVPLPCAAAGDAAEALAGPGGSSCQSGLPRLGAS